MANTLDEQVLYDRLDDPPKKPIVCVTEFKRSEAMASE